MYFESKYRVARHELDRVLEILIAQFGGSDPYPESIVDTVYFDTERLETYQLCAQESPYKIKFRARGYVDGQLSQLQIKSKRNGALSKLKYPLAGATRARGLTTWQELTATLGAASPHAHHLEAMVAPWGILRPCVRVRYRRWRFRVLDERVTLDMELRFDAFPETQRAARDVAYVDGGVLEIKSHRPDPRIPLLGLVSLAPRGLTKFCEGIEQLGVSSEGADRGYLQPALESRGGLRSQLA